MVAIGLERTTAVATLSFGGRDRRSVVANGAKANDALFAVCRVLRPSQGRLVGLYYRKILDHAPAARGGVTGAWRKNRHWNGTGVDVCTRERGHRGTAPPNKGGLGMRRWVHWLCRKKGLGK